MNTSAAYVDNLVTEAHRHHLAGRLVEAEAGYLDALRLKPKHTDALHYLGVLRYQQNDPDTAVKLINRAIKARPDSVEMHLNLGAAYRKLGDATRAVFAYRRAVALKPHLLAAHFNLGHALRDAREFDAAIGAYRTYLKDRPEDAAGHLGLGCALGGAGRLGEAMTAFDTAITFDPNFAEGYNKIGTFLCDQGRFNSALVFHEKAVALAPKIPEWHFDLAIVLLRLGKLAEGWPHFESRCDRELKRVVRRPTPPPYWGGEDLTGKSILVWMEQGVGDQIFLASMLPDLIERAGRCLVECTPRLAPIFARSFPTVEFIGNSELGLAAVSADGVDYQIAAGSLGRYFRPTSTSFPKHMGYLIADEVKSASLRTRYESLAQGRRIVGISWRTRNTPDNESKSADLMGFAPILETPGILFVNLQYGDCRSELAKVKKDLGVDIFQDPEVNPLANMDTFCAQVAAMDLVVTTSNTTAHAAGAQNKPVWILVPPTFGLMWYWFLRREDSPWYPSARLFRGTDPVPARSWWPDVAQNVAIALRGWASTSL
ncbi:MAG: tetratricopeptide repeat protein [Rhodospirillaceae bacterium]|nr:MAG: tetratricopeptide repeat protein [Rhodospirillaceae bacterium]